MRKVAKSLKEQLAKIALKKVKMSDGATLGETMAREAARLRDCIQYYIDAYYRSYEPIIYDRTYGYRQSLFAEDIAEIKVVGNTLRIGVGFNLGLALHDNLEEVYQQDKWGNEYWIPIRERHETFVPIMMERGWEAPRLASMIGRNIHRLTYFEGIHAVEKGIRDFNRMNKLGIVVDADDFFNGRAY